ncbi:MAG TPA: hypothetical protein VIH67_15035 [Candidatus Acidoferrum sp.]
MRRNPAADLGGDIRFCVANRSAWASVGPGFRSLILLAIRPTQNSFVQEFVAVVRADSIAYYLS